MSHLTLLAKPEEKLIEHTENALKVFKSIREAYPLVPDICGVEDFWEHLFYATFLHDFGKGASGFQNVFKGKKWGYRHEILSAGFVSSLDYAEKQRRAISLTVLTHHKDITELRDKYQTHPSPIGKKRYQEKLQELEPNFRELINYYDCIPEFSTKYLGYELKNYNAPKSVNELADTYKDAALEYYLHWEEDEKTELHGKYGIFLKGFLNACDHLSSGSKYEILNAVNDMRSIYKFDLRPTQKKAFETLGDSFLTAPTGSGKTEASLFWSDRNQNEGKSRRVFYLLPYTASINAMYNRLRKDFGNEDLVGVMHSKATYFLYKTFSGDNEYMQAKSKAKEALSLTKKIYRPYKVLTPFQILKAFFGMHWFEMQTAEMANGLFILDEIHAYDAHNTALLLEMLKILKEDYRANIFIMTATFPSFIRELFKDSLKIESEISFGKKEIKKYTRHKIKIIDGNVTENLNKIKEDIKDKKRVLVVCNTVTRAQEVFKTLHPGVKKSVLLHGRFILRDREEIEKILKEMDLLVGTQAIEVSLDIDYDVLYTEPAPIDALIQRFGRVNRKGWEKGRISPVYVFSKGSENDKYIYNQDTVNRTLDELSKVDLLDEDLVQEIVDRIYEKGYSGKDKEEFEIVRKNFKPFYNRIVPFIHDKRNEEDFYSLYQSYEVVPFQYKLQYLEEVEKGHYLDAMSYFTSISIGQYKKLEKESRIEMDQHTKFVNVPYDKRLGLLLGETNRETII